MLCRYWEDATPNRIQNRNPMTLNVCEVGHDTHRSKLVETAYGPFHIWQWDQYQWQGAYCPGQDEVSKSIDVNGYWEKPETDRMLSILHEQSGIVVDFGTHIGWFAVQAARHGATVIGIDSDPENVRLLQMNAGLVRGGSIAVQTLWARDLVEEMPPLAPVRFLKVDLEGAEADAIRITRLLWEERLIDHALIEVSPIFHDGYPEMVDELIGYGYKAVVLKDEGDWVITGADVTFPQENVWFQKLP